MERELLEVALSLSSWFRKRWVLGGIERCIQVYLASIESDCEDLELLSALGKHQYDRYEESSVDV